MVSISLASGFFLQNQQVHCMGVVASMLSMARMRDSPGKWRHLPWLGHARVVGTAPSEGVDVGVLHSLIQATVQEEVGLLQKAENTIRIRHLSLVKVRDMVPS